MEYARLCIDTAGSADREKLTRYENGGAIRGIVTNDRTVRGLGEYADEELGGAAEDMDKKFQMGKRIISVPGQADFKPITATSADMQFLETRKYTDRDICRFFGVHPSFIFDDVATVYKSAEEAKAAFLDMTINPLLIKIETEFHRKLVPKSICCKRRFYFDRKHSFEMDASTKMAFIRSSIENGIYTINDWRKIENRPPVEGGDVCLASANLKSINEFNYKDNDSKNNTYTTNSGSEGE